MSPSLSWVIDLLAVFFLSFHNGDFFLSKAIEVIDQGVYFLFEERDIGAVGVRKDFFDEFNDGGFFRDGNGQHR